MRKRVSEGLKTPGFVGEPGQTHVVGGNVVPLPKAHPGTLFGTGKIDELSDQYEPVRDALEETAGNIWSALGLAAGELKAGFDRVRKAIDEQ